jgi:hypothetical protein
MLRWARVCWFAAALACLLGTSVKAFAAAPELSPEGEGVRCAADRCEFIERFDFTIRVAPRLDDFTAVAESSRAIPQLNWVEVARSRVDRPEPAPPVVPLGLEGVVWAFRHPADGWRVVTPIPPDQVPQLVLPAQPTLRLIRLG